MRASRGLYTLFSAICLCAVLMLTATVANADNTLRGRKLRITGDARNAQYGLKERPQEHFDTIFRPSRDSVKLSGYDKPLRTNRETILLSNDTPDTIRGLALTVSYTDMQGRQLHERTDTLRTDAPPGTTRMLALPTWDTQHSYYYHRSRIPRTANVTPYDVTCHIGFILITKKHNSQ